MSEHYILYLAYGLEGRRNVEDVASIDHLRPKLRTQLLRVSDDAPISMADQARLIHQNQLVPL
eukprot:SAG11_NODE_12931_length_678_cov_1.291883_2_plen_62_part_01